MINYKIRDLRLIVIFIFVLILFLGNIPNISASFGVETKKMAEISQNIPDPNEVSYTVQPGDSVNKIAQMFRVHRYQIWEWNEEIDYRNIIHPGQVITIKKVKYEEIEGRASWYGPGFHGQNMANGEVFDMNSIVVAHRTLPLGLSVKVTNLENGKSIIARVLDRGPYIRGYNGDYTREIDLSYKVAQELDTIAKGVVNVKIEPINESLLIF